MLLGHQLIHLIDAPCKNSVSNEVKKSKAKCVGFCFQLFITLIYFLAGDSIRVEFSPSTIWLLGIELLGLSGLVTCAFAR